LAESVNMAIIGCGGMSGAHVRGLELLREAGASNINVVAVCDIVEENARRRAVEIARFQEAPMIYKELREMLGAEPSIDAVDICTEHRSHHLVAAPCLEEGKHVIIEKPLAITMRACRLIIDAAERSGRVLAVAENYRRMALNRAINWAIRQGRIGKPRMLFWLETGYGLGAWGWRHDRLKAGGGWILDGGVHFADLFIYNLGDVQEVYAVAKTLEPLRYQGWPEKTGPQPYTVEDLSLATLKFKSGADGLWAWTGVAPGETLNHRVIHGEDGSIGWNRGLVQTGPGNVGQYTVSLQELRNEMMKSLGEEERRSLFPGGLDGPNSDVAIELWDFADAILRKRKPEVDGYLGRKAEAVPIAVYESSWLGEPVELRRVENCEVENYQREINESLNI